jgi:prolyl-tRNA synthetase
MNKNMKGITVKKDENFTEWFTEIVQKAELADHSSVSGCMVIRPYGFKIWEKIVELCDKEFKKIGVENSYFPMFIPEHLLKKEEEHVEGFAPEVAWVDYGGNTKLGERLAIRPTSEAIMYDSYAKWIRSWRDLPLLINQWNNVVRWEFKNPVLFFRTREFLWNEMHTVFATEKESLDHGKKVMKAYNKVTEEFMGLGGLYGRKTEKEKFAGAEFTEKVHHYLSNGRVLEGTCFHSDGQKFAKAYDIKFKDKEAKDQYVFQNTHAISTRMLGAMLAIHSDDKGLVLPPKMAPNSVVVIPLLFKKDPAMEKVLKKSQDIFNSLKKYKPIFDDREEYSSGWKFNEWELKGIPLRIELGPKDLDKKEVIVYRRDISRKESVKFKDLDKYVENTLKEMQVALYEKSTRSLFENVVAAKDYVALERAMNNKKIALLALCENGACEDQIKGKTGGAKSICISSRDIKGACLNCGKEAKHMVYFAKTY